MNDCKFTGRLTKDPEVRYTHTGKAVAQFTLAVDRPFKTEDGQKEADFIPIVCWGKLGEVVGNNLVKGRKVLVSGRLQIRSYDAKDGTKRWVSEIIAHEIEFLEPKGGNNYGGQNKEGMESFGSPVAFDEEIPF